MSRQPAIDDDAIWKALADSTRREVLDALRDGPRTTSELVERFPHLTRFGVMKHVEVLREAGLVNARAEGRKRINSLNAAPLRKVVERWISRYDGFWANTLLRVKDDAQAKPASSRTRKKKA
ncbi:HTH-type transcriptional regulator [Planctomycetes bacterium MalM25]|nr:HTH-type transcriptional regulator [Planctomycetes bacterium MalM25]